MNLPGPPVGERTLVIVTDAQGVVGKREVKGVLVRDVVDAQPAVGTPERLTPRRKERKDTPY